MYFEFDDYRPDITPVGQAISWREGVLISIIVHMAMVIFVLLIPRLFPDDGSRARAIALAQAQAQAEPAPSPRFIFVQPRVDPTAPKPPDRAELSDKDRIARVPEMALKPDNPLPYARGNTPERVEAAPEPSARGRGPEPDPMAGEQAQVVPQPPESQSALQLPSMKPPPLQDGANGRSRVAGGSLGEALKNLERYVQRESFDNQQGGGGTPGASIQFDTKGVEFGPWLRRFVAQIKRNWFIPYAAMAMKGHVVITFNVHKDGLISDLQVVGPSAVDAFNNAAYGALMGSNPTQPLPPEYPADRAFFTVTFYYNEPPP